MPPGTPIAHVEVRLSLETSIAHVEVRLLLETSISRCNTSLERISYVLLALSFPLLLLAFTFCANSSSISLSHCFHYTMSLAAEEE